MYVYRDMIPDELLRSLFLYKVRQSAVELAKVMLIHSCAMLVFSAVDVAGRQTPVYFFGFTPL